jgi:transcription-repair coupling factor (superfamily II helicase)
MNLFVDPQPATASTTAEPPSLRPLRGELLRDQGMAGALQAVVQGGRAQLDGVWGSATALVAAALADQVEPAPVLVVCPQAGLIDAVVDDLELFTPRTVISFPALQAQPHRVLQDDNYGERLRTLKHVLHGDPAGLIVTAIQALMQPAPERQRLADKSRWLRVGQALDAGALAGWLAESGYHSTSAVELPGEFSLRGGILDVFATDWDRPVRIELFGDEIESLRRFDLTSQRSLETLPHIELTVLGSDGAGNGSLLDYLPERSVVVLIEPDDLRHHGDQFLQHTEPAAEFRSVAEVLKECQPYGLLCVSALASGRDELMHRAPIESVERFSGDIARVRQELDQVSAGQQVFLVAETDAEVRRLSEILSTTGVGSDGRLRYIVGRLNAGFRLLGPDVLVISGNELFHRMPLKRTPRRRLSKAIESFLDLRNGDLVVHLAHGIGRYRGLKLLDKDGRVEEHLELEFHAGTRIYVPSSKIELVQKYVGARKIMPRLATIGGKNWLRQKKAAEAAVEDLAADLLQLQAERQASPGIRFADDTDWQQEFDASFPYSETADQLTAIDSIKADMQTARPMDRLICGDVGFGKTELAMRAAFKAVDNGYQVAVLVPTTILAEQHYRTFVERLAEFPFSIAKLSRFCSPQEQREAIRALRRGGVDIVIGTHRLASKDVEFENLGLLIIDEEQRFGVEVKERLKAMRSSVDVLTLSATPIPRTLHMSLTGIRDISNLETPPEDRVAVETRVTRWSHELIRHSIERELSRDGQVYFVHNRICDIEAIAKKLKYIVPEASIAIGHGQMHEGELERVMVDFVHGRFDILLATTIVESGLDIPNVNTIFIDDAHRYGLADLHQLRGRVGRYKHRAYCYLLVDPDKSVTPNAARRLRAIEEFSDMGAGFSIAMRDLEIRGAGNVLGTQQSGHIALMGYELYCQLLEAAVRRMKQLPPKMAAEVDIELPGQAFIPRDYVPDMRTKIDLYRRLARSVGDEAIEQMRQEFIDRFGPLPDEVERLLTLARLKSDAAFWQIDTIRLERPYMVFHYKDLGRANQLIRQSCRRLRIVDDRCLYLNLPDGSLSPDAVIQFAMSALAPPAPSAPPAPRGHAEGSKSVL